MASLTHGYEFGQFSGSWWCTRKPGMLQSMGSQRVRHDWVTELNWCQGGLCDWYFEPILTYNHNITDKTACFISYWDKHDIISTMLWRFAFLFISVGFYITYFKSLLAVYIFKSFTSPSLIEHLNCEMSLYEQNFLLRSILYFDDYWATKDLVFLGYSWYKFLQLFTCILSIFQCVYVQSLSNVWLFVTDGL